MTLFGNNIWGTSSFFDQFDLNDFELFTADPSELSLEDQTLRSIYLDCQQIESLPSSVTPCTEIDNLSDFDDFSKVEIKNLDCMWSGLCMNNTSKKQTITGMVNTNNKNTQNAIKQNNQTIPPGASLLLNSKTNQKNNQMNFTIPHMTTANFLKDREILQIPRPDTPLSLDDDVPEFKNIVDVSACITGSNNISLKDSEKIIINKLVEQLEDPNAKNIDIKQIMPGNKHRSLSEVLNIIENEPTSTPTPNLIKTEPEDIDSDDAETLPSTPIFSSSVAPSETNDLVTHDDHCYTRSNGAINVAGMGLETPSDSDEEIDVVSIGDKKLPNNPSDKDVRALQTKVANKISARLIKTTVNGVRTIPPRRRCSYEPYTAPVTPVKTSNSNSNSNSRYPTPASTPYSYHSSPISPVKHSAKSRKRRAGVSHRDDRAPSSQRYRTKKHKPNRKQNHNGKDEPVCIEKRNLHNDMERQRRIGLKNLFDELKKHVPNIKEKERTPKVSILREAAKYTELIIKQEKNLMAQKYQLQLQKQRRLAQLQILQMSSVSIKK